MATYKLIQDIEAEDHILGPLSLRQFIFALLAAFLMYLCFLSVTKHVLFFLAILMPPALFCAFFAFPWGRDQPTETWALAKLRFWFKPRRRIWNQSGIRELVTITVPKKVERVLTDNLSQTEVKSRLQALANTIDSRGWAIKHINAVGYTAAPVTEDSDRLIDIPDIPPQEAPEDLTPADDIMDADHSPIAQQFQTMIDKSTQDYRQKLIDQLRQPVPEQPASQSSGQWFMNHNPVPPAAPAVSAVPAPPAPVDVAAVAATQPQVQASDTAEDAVLSKQLKRQAAPTTTYSNLRTLQPLSSQPAAPVSSDAVDGQAASQMSDDVSTAVTAGNDPAILSLSKNNDLNVATIAREAHRTRQGDKSQDEVVVSLHGS